MFNLKHEGDQTLTAGSEARKDYFIIEAASFWIGNDNSNVLVGRFEVSTYPCDGAAGASKSTRIR